ncbi:MAG: hypothetical protein GXY41_09350 [Phycisphaerae bacterium]|nr:hypothetical protein [Phycisphaerae bacterium]
MNIDNAKWYCFSDKALKQASALVFERLKQSISQDKKWSWTASRLNPRDLCFESQRQVSDSWVFSLFVYEPAERCGYGAFQKRNSRKDPFSEYLVLVFSDCSTMQAWTLSDAEDTTYIALNGLVCGHIKSYWKHFLFRCFRWCEKWDVYWNDVFEGTIKTGDYILNGRIFCKSLVKYDTLKLTKADGHNIPIRLAREEDKASDFLLLPLKIPLALSGQRFDRPDYVIPRTESSVCDECLEAAFALNIVFRELYFDLNRPDIGG